MLINLNKNSFDTEVDLPLSKSESNRALMIAFYRNLELCNSKTLECCDSVTKDYNNLETWRLGDSVTSLSNSDDTVLLENLLNKINQYIKNFGQSPLSVDYCPLTLNCHNAGTVFRFLMTAVSFLQLTINNLQFTIGNELTQQLGDSVTHRLGVLLTGSDRMKQRPIDSLVDALRSLGVSIKYKEKEGYPPILIRTTTNRTNLHKSFQHQTDICDTRDSRSFFPCRLEISTEKSSQFASSLLLAAPLLENGLELHLTGNISSLPYIDMTINMMRQCGVDVVRNERVITVKPGIYNIDNIAIEPDWSAAAFWYEMIALSDDSKILLKNLNIDSLQADSVAAKMFENLGVETISVKEGIIIKKSTFNFQLPTFNFKSCPDLFPAVIAACAGLRLNSTFSGLKNLSIKESDRKKAMMNGLRKINISFEEISDDELKMFCPEELPYFTEENPIIFNNYDDHRIAMALSILSMKIGAISMENTEVVSKSYPRFFEEFTIKFQNLKT